MQYTLAFSSKLEHYNPDEYIIFSANQEAYENIMKWPHCGIPPYQKFMLLKGPHKSGKTHLSHVWAKISHATFIRPHDDICTSYKAIQQAPAFVVEDIDKIAEKPLLHFFNLLHENDKFALFTTSRDEAYEIPDLDSRINVIKTIRIKRLSQDGVKVMIIKEFSKRSIKVSMHVVSYLAKHLSQNFEAISKATAVLDQISLASKRPITIKVAHQALYGGDPYGT